MKIVFGSDEKVRMNEALIRHLESKGHKLVLVGHLVDDAKKWKWVGIGKEVGERVAKGEGKYGIVACWTGTGVAMAANKVKGARAALCWDAETARGARKWDNANILCLSNRFVSETLAKEIADAFLAAEFNEEGLNEAGKLDVGE